MKFRDTKPASLRKKRITIASSEMALEVCEHNFFLEV